MKRPDGVTLIAMFDFLMGGLTLLGACAILTSMSAIFLAPGGEAEARIVGAGFMSIGLIATVAIAGIGLLAGWGLLKLKEWARWLTIIFGILMLFGFPIGTIIGALIIWYLLQPQVALAFGSGVPVVPPMPALASAPGIPAVPAAPVWSAPVAPAAPLAPSAPANPPAPQSPRPTER